MNIFKILSQINSKTPNKWENQQESCKPLSWSGGAFIGWLLILAIAPSAQAINLNWTGHNTLSAASTFARLRFTSDTNINASTPKGLASDGEVEDYQITITSLPKQSYCEKIGGTLNTTRNLFNVVDNGTFGTGTARNQISSLPPELTAYRYEARYPPNDGAYAVSTYRDTQGFNTWHFLRGHTTGEETDRFLVVNAGKAQLEIIEDTIIDGLRPFTNYTFSAYIANVIKNNPNHIDPNISFNIDLIGIDDDNDGTIDEPGEREVHFNTGDIPESEEFTWIQFGSLFNTGSATSARFIISNNKAGGFGNDLAIDDIALQECSVASGNLEGTLYYDADKNDTFDPSEDKLPSDLIVWLINTQGTSQIEDDVIVSRFPSVDGEYSFFNIPVGNNYQVLAPDDDGLGRAIGTTNPLTSLSVTAGSTTSNQNFGYDLNPNLLLVKRITAINPGQSDQRLFSTFNEDGIADNADNDPNWLDTDIYLPGATQVTQVKPGDEVEYTIYFLSDGDIDASKVQICDVVPDNMTFVKDLYGVEQGIGLELTTANPPSTDPPTIQLSNIIGDEVAGTNSSNSSAQGAFYPPGTNPPALCRQPDPNDPNPTPNLINVDRRSNVSGAVWLQLQEPLPSTSSDTSDNSYGFIRFRARVD